MSCVLSISGKNFDVDIFVSISEIGPYKIFYKDSPMFNTKPDGKKLERSGCLMEASDAPFNEFDKQLTDVVKYLNTNKEKLKLINVTNGIEHAILDFGVELDENKFVQTHFFPNELLKTASELGISIKLSMYNQSG